ncbi:bifunctional phosphopantothenoylcysteine decarboxylase/phosphopantothenate--cysteine ligase CoaBC [Marichromatium sp. AB32]|uniref:bifunctional phosphopantothenoylcysteine decarboxylase/phosphopantothenate--cysteine ligase CoaBC n=1 Tax=Marichromatium sp. AB32 TaxID=2483363 RepID=UPI000F3C444A|nr:bifunctional phosphopantothenoylcysteine decarboxylase/phosphopantothenate--cysteine ligase CoaBC [Marichromatium sp. AB32]RNE92580.1 bifunctional phosphopantothenoylcysteine decarboxylase/phosphopantothenate--cysteine ligase CoaBC [Marichromatium sp. AB32]
MSTQPSAGSRILLGVGGGIAAYKSVELVRRLSEQGCEVQVVMTRAATAFVGPLTFQAVSGRPARVEMLDPGAEAGMGHIELARWADQILIAPATADLMARLAAGIADDLLTTLVLASPAPLAIAPAMNQQMWRHPATQDNLARLRARGVQVIGPGVGVQACGDEGPGRMLEPAEIAAALHPARPLDGVRVLLTAGPTREPLDPVRYLGNRSSGRMGYALAEALTALGARVTLVSGPTALTPPPVEQVVQVETALQMHAEVIARADACELFVGTAAVADYRPVAPAETKIKKEHAALEIRLERNPDILAEVAARRPAPFTVGFAAETERVEHYARGKLVDKGLDMIAANRVGGPRGGFEREENALTVLWPDGQRDLPMMAKPRLARALAELIAERYLEHHAPSS